MDKKRMDDTIETGLRVDRDDPADPAPWPGLGGAEAALNHGEALARAARERTQADGGDTTISADPEMPPIAPESGATR